MIRSLLLFAVGVIAAPYQNPDPGYYIHEGLQGPPAAAAVGSSLTSATSAATSVTRTGAPTTTITSSSGYKATTSKARHTSTASLDACGSVSILVVEAQATSTPTNGGVVLPADLAFNCLQAVPLHKDDAILWLRSIQPYLDWQSTIAYLKNPPKGYLEPAHDLFGAFNSIVSGVTNGTYKTEYDLAVDIHHLFSDAHDEHFHYTPKILALFNFDREEALVSVSLDGQAAPKPYIYSDVVKLATGYANFTPSAISKINGQDIQPYLEDWSQMSTAQDPDALYNGLFVNLAQISVIGQQDGSGTFRRSGVGKKYYLGPTTVYTFENSSTALFDNYARTSADFLGINNGQDVYSMYLNPPPATSSSSSLATTVPETETGTATQVEVTATSVPAPGYPTPVIRQERNLIGGYYLDGAESSYGSDYSDVAVLSVPTFDDTDASDSFRDTSFEFLSLAKADGKTRLVIDLTANGGGTILQGYSLFLNLFPDLVPYGASRFRSHKAWDLVGDFVNNFAPNTSALNTSDPSLADFIEAFGQVSFPYENDLDENLHHFTSWDQKNGPHSFYGDNFTSIVRWDLQAQSDLPESAGGFVINGYNNRTGIVESRPFDPKDIVILTDGACASTCTIFAEFLTEQAGIKTIVMGGRASNKGKQQVIGGVRGSNVWPMTLIKSFVDTVIEYSTPEQLAFYNQTVLADYNDLLFTRASGAPAVNSRNAYRMNDTSQTPLHFVNSPADCRLYYTPEMMVDVSMVWAAAADAMWNGAPCVDGNLSHKKRDMSLVRSATTKKFAQSDVDALLDGANRYLHSDLY